MICCLFIISNCVETNKYFSFRDFISSYWPLKHLAASPTEFCVASLRKMFLVAPEFNSQGNSNTNSIQRLHKFSGGIFLVKNLAQRVFSTPFVSGMDARGFLIAPMVACNLDKPFAPIRKKGKLPGKCLSADSVKEYGKVRYFTLSSETVDQ